VKLKGERLKDWETGEVTYNLGWDKNRKQSWAMWDIGMRSVMSEVLGQMDSSRESYWKKQWEWTVS